MGTDCIKCYKPDKLSCSGCPFSKPIKDPTATVPLEQYLALEAKYNKLKHQFRQLKKKGE